MQAHHADTFRASVTSVLGAPPDPAPLQPEVLDTVNESGFRREHIKYQVSPGDWGYAYLLIPDNVKMPAPVVYCHHRHDYLFNLGKAELVGLDGDKHYAIGLDLVKRGYVVFAPDMLGFGERRSPKSDGPTFDLAYSFHQFALRLLRGETLLEKVLWDISRGIDYLETRSEVDKRFLGLMGIGFGGKMAMWAAAVEPRIRVVAALGGIITYREQLKRGEWFQAEFVVPRLMQVADMHHIVGLVAPRPCLISALDGDSHSADAADIYQKALPMYEKQGAANRLTLYRYRAGNGLTPSMRYNAYNWLDSWLLPF